ncbi:MAG: Fe-S protein assembly co-chaperone HscB [Burkholderiales bacterium]
MKNHFELFGLTPAYALDAGSLERSYREIQSSVHPDRHAQAGDAQRRASMQWTTRVNEAYRTLKSPVQRARYLLELNGVDVQFETDTQMPADFLQQQMELREALEQAAAPAALDQLMTQVRGEKTRLEGDIARLLDSDRDYAVATAQVRKLMFLERLGEEIEQAYEELE